MEDTLNCFLVVFTDSGRASVWGNCRSLGHFVVASAMLLEEVHHNNRGVLQAT
jgi:hypothetical protein